MSKNKPRRATSKQVAELAGVSQTTVSFVLNDVGDANISAETRERVLRAAHELNYVPDVAARALARGRSNNIALVLMQPHRQVWLDEYIPNVLTGVNLITQPLGFRLLVEMVEGNTGVNVFANLLQSKEAAGVIVNFNHSTEPEISRIVACTEQGLPIVSLANIDPIVHSVEVDKMDGARRIVQYLIDLGHRRIACVSYASRGQNPHADERVTIFRETLASAGIAVEEDLIDYGEFEPETGYDAMQRILERTSPPTAVYAMNDVMAFGVLHAIQDRGLRVPEDIAVTGFDDIRLAAFSNPPLTTMNEPDIEHGRLAAEMLIDLINGRTPKERHIRLETQLVVRQSCGATLQQK